jgi:hypothetical protein
LHAAVQAGRGTGPARAFDDRLLRSVMEVMDPAVVAVAGTLAGVTVTAVTALATTVLSQRSRRTLIQEQDSPGAGQLQ